MKIDMNNGEINEEHFNTPNSVSAETEIKREYMKQLLDTFRVNNLRILKYID